MKEKRIIEYRKNGQDIKKEFNFLTRKEILKDLFERPYYQTGNPEFYKIKEDVELLSLKNIEFKKSIRIVTPSDSVLIMDECTFKSGNIDIVGGNVTLHYPNLSPEYYVNRIHLSAVNNLDITISDNNKSFITIAGTAKDARIIAKDRIETIAIKGEKAYLENIKEIKNLRLNNQNTTLKNCNIKIKSEIETSTLDLKNTTINTNNNLNISAKRILTDGLSKIKTNQNLSGKRELIVMLKEIKKTLEPETNKKRKRINRR